MVNSARLKFEEGLYRECLRQCQRSYADGPSNAENLLLLAACHFQLGQMRESAFYGRQAIGVDPALAEARVTVANALREPTFP